MGIIGLFTRSICKTLLEESRKRNIVKNIKRKMSKLFLSSFIIYLLILSPFVMGEIFSFGRNGTAIRTRGTDNKRGMSFLGNRCRRGFVFRRSGRRGGGRCVRLFGRQKRS